jgi:2-polyprenyl-3-methyl-5-hydroxy-6-metoxy-1,4-benzoquinol methylase
MLLLLVLLQVPHHGGFKPIGGIEGNNPGYDASRAPAKVVAALGLTAGQRVADVGAGRGYLTLRLADAVGAKGRVVATDVDDDAIATLQERTKGRAQVSVRKTRPDDPMLEAGAYDLILLSEVDHFLHDRLAFLRKLKGALAPNGHLAVTHVRAMRPPLETAAREAGFVVASEYDGLPDHYLLIFAPAR